MIPELEAIKRLFLHEWDAICVAESPEVNDEYDTYALRVFTSLHEERPHRPSPNIWRGSNPSIWAYPQRQGAAK